jgi:hypothetical protein
LLPTNSVHVVVDNPKPKPPQKNRKNPKAKEKNMKKESKKNVYLIKFKNRNTKYYQILQEEEHSPTGPWQKKYKKETH